MAGVADRESSYHLSERMRKNRQIRLSQSALKSLESGQWCSESLGYGKGSLQVRATPSGIRYYYRTGGERARIALGPGSGPRALSLDEARDKCRRLAAGKAGSRTGCDSLGALLLRYAERLEARSTVTAASVLAMLTRHVQRPHPMLWSRSARTIAPQDIVHLLEPLVQQGKLPTARKLRSSLNAAFQVAVAAPLCAQSAEFRHFEVTVNPVSSVSSLGGELTLPDQVLSVAELRAFWDHLAQMRSARGSVLRFYLLTGAQRLEQLLRARREDLIDEGLILWDRKGRRQRARLHLVPLIAPARLAMAAMSGHGPYVVSIDGGRSGLHPSTLWRYVTEVADALLDQGTVQARFSPADLRRTVETRLAALQISPEVRAHLQSHGLAGVQTRHYDRHTYLNEKRDALQRLFKLVCSGE